MSALHPLFTTAWPNCSKLCGLLHFRLGCGQQKIPAILKLSLYKVSTPKHFSLKMPTKYSKRDRGEEKLAVVQNTPRQQFEIDDTPEPTPDYDQVFCFSLSQPYFLAFARSFPNEQEAGRRRLWIKTLTWGRLFQGWLCFEQLGDWNDAIFTIALWLFL